VATARSRYSWACSLSTCYRQGCLVWVDMSIPEVTAAYEPSAPAHAGRLALRVLQLGAIVVVLIATTYKPYELDRFFLPKELILHLTAVLAALLVLGAF